MSTMQEEKAFVTLGKTQYPVQALTFDQLQEVLGAIYAAGQPGVPLTERLKSARAALLPALGIDAATFGAIPMTVPDIMAAIGVVARVTGLVPATPVPATAGETTAATGTA